LDKKFGYRSHKSVRKVIIPVLFQSSSNSW